MDEEPKLATNEIKFMHLTKLHKRVQTKYEEMQQKLLKSRSMDSLLCEDGIELSTGQPHGQKKDSISEILFTEKAIEKQISRESVILEEIETDELFSHDIEMCFLENVGDCANTRAVPSLVIEEVNDNPKEYYSSKFNDSVSECTNGSRESLGDISKESEEISWPPTPPPRISLRDRIGSKISAAKEKRRRKEREKQDAKNSREKIEWYTFNKTIKQDIVNVKPTKRIKIATVTVALIEANGLRFEKTDIKPRMANCRLRLGTEKAKSKLIKGNSTKVEWLELFNLNMYDDDEMLEISLWDKEFYIGKSNIDLTTKEKDKTYKTKIKLNEEPGVKIFILLTITGTPLINTVCDATDYFNIEEEINDMKNKYAWHCMSNEDGTVGRLKVIVYGAMGLVGIDCHCILELGNDRLQTQTEYRTNNPNWMKVFTFDVADITSILEITIHDEKKTEDVGKLSISLLDIKNGEKKWFALKDNSQKERAKGNNPRILLEMTVCWNLLRASLNVLAPKEEKYLENEDKLDRHLFVHNLSRAKAVVFWVFDAFKVIKNCFEWESTKLNLIALLIWLISCWCYKVWMLPLMLLIPFAWYRPEKYYFIDWETQLVTYKIIEKQTTKPPESEVKQEKEKEEKTTLRQKFNSIQEMVLSVQSFIGKLACFGESIKNLFNFNVPYLSCLAIFFILVISFVMLLIPIQYIFMIWGVHKFMRKILRPNRIPNNEVLDFLSRVPNDEVLIHCRELPLEDMDN